MTIVTFVRQVIRTFTLHKIERMNQSNLSLTFLGAAGTVTGSKTVVEHNKVKVLVDCGLFQGLKVLRLLNRQPLPLDPAEIKAVIITHAHLDHVGYVPLLVKNGFNGPIYATPPTCDLARIILLDSAKIQEEDARLANEGKYTRHAPAEPLYTVADAETALKLFVPVDDEQWLPITNDLKFQFHRNGHILGSCSVEIIAGEKKIVFSGDMGREHPILLEPPVWVKETDYLVMESTYGDREHTKTPTDAELATIVTEALLKQGNLIIPTFAVERAQEIMLILNVLKSKNMIPQGVPIYLDSPMGIDSTEVYMKYPDWHTLSPESCKMICNDTIRVGEISETMAIIKEKHSKIIIAGSGMLTGGRALEYLKAYVGNASTTVLFVGFQAEGTRGRAMLQGAGSIKIHGKYYGIKAEVKEITSFSGHADRTELMNWLSHFTTKPKRIFLNHGELNSSDALRLLIHEQYGIEAEIPLMNSRVEL